MTSLAHPRLNLGRRSLMRGALAVTALSSVPAWRGYAGEAVSLGGDKIFLSDRDLMDLQRSLAGPVILPSDAAYDQERRVWSPRVDNRPAVIAKCTSLDDMRAALQFARSHNLLTALRCGGHSVDGISMADGGLTLDLSPYSGVEVDLDNKIAYVKGGSLLGDLDRATVPHGLGTTAGVVSHTGIGGLATGIGQGRLARSHGYTIDNIRGVTVITADGNHLRADGSENSDLHWAVRGGSGNFGIVTEFELQLHEMDLTVTSFSFTYPAEKAEACFKTLFELGEQVPNDMSLGAGIATDGRGETTSSFRGTYIGSPGEARKIIDPYVEKLGKPIRVRFDGINYVTLQSIGDGPVHSNVYAHNETGFFNHVDDSVAEAFAEYGTKYPEPYTSIGLSQQGGIANTVARDATAFPHRDTIYQCTVGVQWFDPKDGPQQIKYAKDCWGVLGQMSAGGFYVNSAVDPTDDDIRRIYADNLPRLVDVKSKYDPTNFFRLNANIKPTSAT